MAWNNKDTVVENYYTVKRKDKHTKCIAEENGYAKDINFSSAVKGGHHDSLLEKSIVSTENKDRKIVIAGINELAGHTTASLILLVFLHRMYQATTAITTAPKIVCILLLWISERFLNAWMQLIIEQNILTAFTWNVTIVTISLTYSIFSRFSLLFRM